MSNTPAPLQQYGFGAFGFLMGYQAAVVGSVQTIPVLTPWIAQSLPALQGLIGFFVSWVILSALMCAGAVAAILRQSEAVRAGAISLAVMAFGLSLITFSETFVSFAVAGLCIGVGYAVVNPVGSQIVAGLGQQSRNNVLFSIKQSSVSIGAGGVGLLLPWVADWAGWHAAVGCMVLVSITLVAIGWQVKPALHASLAGRPRLSLRDLIPISAIKPFVAHPEGKPLAFASMTLSLTQYGTMAIYVVWLWGSLDVAPETAGQMFFVAMAGAILGRLVWGYLADLSRPAVILQMQMLTGAMSALIMAWLPSDIWHGWLWLFSAFLGFVPMSWSGILLSEVTRAGMQTKDPRAGIIAMTSGVVVLFYLGGLTGPALLSLVYLTFGSYSPGFVLFAGLFLTSWILYRQGRRAASARQAG